jgi:hypothetical protein
MNPTYLIEECAAISIGSIKRDLRFELADDETFLIFDAGDGHITQRIELTMQAVTFGVRYYFECNCGLRVNKLYLPPGQRAYKCRTCYRLRYEITTFNRSSGPGQLLYRTNRMIKLANKRAGMNRVMYGGRYTRRFERFLNLCGRAGLADVINDARTFKEAMASL